MGILNSTLKCLGGQGSFKPNSIFEYITRSSVSKEKGFNSLNF